MPKPLEITMRQATSSLTVASTQPQLPDWLGCTLSIHACNSLLANNYLVPNEAATLAHVIPQMHQFTNIMFSGVINELKKLRLGFREPGSGWTAI